MTRRMYAGALRMIISLMVVCLLLALASVITSDASEEDYIKVGLRYGSSTATATVTSDGGFAIGTASEASIYSISSLSGGNSLTLALSGGRVYVKDSSGNILRTLAGDGKECILGGNYATDKSDCIGFNGKSYRGAIIPYINSSGQMNIINFLSLDDYTRGVIHNEIGQSSPLEAIKVQAVATRSFAYTISGKHSSQGFDICTTTHCQVYNGAGTEYASTNRAVDETKDEMIWYGGKPVQAYYAANSGGYTENSEDTWSAALGYARSKPDPYSPDKIWTATITRAQLTKKFASKGIGTVQSITINKVNPSGYVSSITINGSIKSTTISKEAIRSGLGISLKSRNFIFGTTGGMIVGSIKRAVSGTGSLPASNVSLAAIDESGIYDGTSSEMLIDGYKEAAEASDDWTDDEAAEASDDSSDDEAAEASDDSSDDEASLASEIPISYVQGAQGKSILSSVITALSFTGKTEKSADEFYAINCNGKVVKLCTSEASTYDDGEKNNGNNMDNDADNGDNGGINNGINNGSNNGNNNGSNNGSGGIVDDDGDGNNSNDDSNEKNDSDNQPPSTVASDEIPVVTGSSTASGTMTVVFNSDSDVLIINGKGYGHGVGLSQQGAQQMAKLGFNYRQILKFYYTGIEIK